MNFDTNQKPKNQKRKDPKIQPKLIGDENIVYDTSNYCSCLEKVLDYSKIKNFVVTFVEIKKEEVPSVLYDTKGLEWQVWRKDYGEVLKYYWYNDLLDKKVRILDNETQPTPQGYVRLYRGIPEQNLPKKSIPKKINSFVKKKEKKELLQHESA